MTALVRLVREGHPAHNRLALAVLAGIAALGCAIGLFAVSGFLIARAAQHPSITALSVAVVAVRALAIGRGGFRYLERLATHDVALRVLADVRVWVFERLQRVPPARFLSARRGDVLARLVSDVDSVQDLFVRALVPALSAGLVCVAVVVGVAQASVPVAVAIAAGLVFSGVAVPLVILVLAVAPSRRLASARGVLAAEATETLAGADELIVFGAIDAALARVAAGDAELARLSRREAGRSALDVGLSTVAVGATVWVVLIVGTSALRAGTLGPVALAVVTLTALAAFEATQGLPAAANVFASARAAASRILEVTEAPDAIADPVEPVPVPESPHRLRLSEASVRYSADGPWALDRIDLDLSPGRRIALLGPNGAGKSSLIAALLRFVDLDHGHADLDGVPLRRLDSEDLHRVVSGVTQHPHVFSTTLRNNLLIGKPDADDADLAAVAERVGLGDWVRRLPDGWATDLGSEGTRVSGGQRQRIALARALLADPDILVLDEPTAHLDLAARRSLTDHLLTARPGKTVVLATHDRIGLDQVDEIVVLDRGRIVDRRLPS